MFEIKIIKNEDEARRVGLFLISPNVFEQNWAPNEKDSVSNYPVKNLINPNHGGWYIEDKGEIIASIGVEENKYGSGGYQMDADYLAVHKDYRKQGLATRLLAEMEKWVQKKGGRFIHILSCDIDSYKAARTLWEKHGYEKVAEIPDYYVEGEGRVDYFKKIV